MNNPAQKKPSTVELTAPAGPEKANRITSIDALRGFDMVWIIGGEKLVHASAELSSMSGFEFCAGQMRHSFVNGMTEGFSFYDLIFPLFMFLAGVTVPLSMKSKTDRGASKMRIAVGVAKRCVVLFVLGMIYNGFLNLDWENQRYWSVLGRIGVAYGIAALIYLYGGVRPATIIAVLLLAIFGFAPLLLAVPGFETGDFTREGNLIGYIDRTILPHWLYPHQLDPEGLASTLPASTNVTMGILAGLLLTRTGIAGFWKVVLLAGAGIGSLAMGVFLSEWLPVMKDLWTSTFALVAGGWSLILLSLFYLAFDVFNAKRMGFIFVVIGANSITIYMLHRIVDFHGISHFFLGGLAREGFSAIAAQEIVIWSGVLAVQWLLLLALYKNRLFLRV